MKQENFVMIEENYQSPVLITVPHGGMRINYGSWLNNFFKSRINIKENPSSEKIVLGGDGPVLHIACDILQHVQVNIVAGLLPRIFVDYNRFVAEVAYYDKNLKPYYDYYHDTISKIIENLMKIHKNILLIDLHGFKDSLENNFDIIVGTNDGESSQNNYDISFYKQFYQNYNISVPRVSGIPEKLSFRGDTTNLFYYQKYGIDGMLVEISRKFRNSKEYGQKLSEDIANFVKAISQ